MTYITDYEIRQTYEATMNQTTRLTSDAAAEEVRDLKLSFDPMGRVFEPGMNVGVLVPGPHPFGNEQHLRLYTIMDLTQQDGMVEISICVRRCLYIDEISGESYRGIASNFLCNCIPGDTVILTGPYGNPFTLPEEPDCNLLMIALGTGIAPFKAMVRDIYQSGREWQGKVRLFYGARSGLEMIYMNDERNDFAQYYDQQTFQAFQAVSPRPHLDDPIALDQSLKANREEVWAMLNDPDTYVYVAGLTLMRGMLEETFTTLAESPRKWARKLAEMSAGGRWQELLY